MNDPREQLTSRRSFVGSLLAVGGGLRLPKTVDRLTVEATPTVFYRHDNNLSLVRFIVTGTTAPAGRLRIYDRSRRFLGTAGVIRSSGRLYGEFWLPFDGPTSFATDLELPGRSPFRSNHRLVPKKKWTLHWTTLVSGDELSENLTDIAADSDFPLDEQEFFLNPAPTNDFGTLLLDQKFRYLSTHAALANGLGIPVGEIAYFVDQHIPPSTPALLAASGVRFAITQSTDPVHWIEGPDGARLVAIGVGNFGDPRALGFHSNTDAMVSLIERFLDRQTEENTTTVLVAGNNLGTDRESVLFRVEEWNGRFAFPRIQVGDATEIFSGTNTLSIPTRTLSPPESGEPNAARLRDMAGARADAVDELSTQLLASVLLASDFRSEDEFFASLSLPSPGSIVVNATPFVRSDVALRADGGEFIATHVPEVGFAFIAGAKPLSPASSNSELAYDGPLRLRIDSESGAIASLVDSTGNQWIPSGGRWNSVANTRLDEAFRETIPGLGTRFNLKRWSSARGTLRSIITVYDDSRWIDISNECEGVGSSAIEYDFDMNLEAPFIEWDLTATTARGPAPLGRMQHDRFVNIHSDEQAVWYRCLQNSHFSVDADSRLTTFAARNRCDIRLATNSGPFLPDDVHRFGWSADPFKTVEVSGTGSVNIPTFGSFLSTDRGDILIVGVRPAADGNGIVVYLQDVGGVGGRTQLLGGVLRFGTAQPCDLLERNTGSAEPVINGGASLRVESRAVTAVRLTDLHIATT